MNKFVGLKSKMLCILSNDGKKVNIAMEFNEHKDILFNKRVIGHKMRRISQ